MQSCPQLLPPLFRAGGPAAGQPVIRQLVSLRGFWAAAPGPAAAAACSGQWRGMWGEPPSREEVRHRDSFYDNVIETWATKVRRPGFGGWGNRSSSAGAPL